MRKRSRHKVGKAQQRNISPEGEEGQAAERESFGQVTAQAVGLKREPDGVGEQRDAACEPYGCGREKRQAKRAQVGGKHGVALKEDGAAGCCCRGTRFLLARCAALLLDIASLDSCKGLG